jgi:uncharacterized protein (DUF2384 family)
MSYAFAMDAQPEPENYESINLTPGERLSGNRLACVIEQIAAQSSDILGSKERAQDWLRSHPIPALDGKTAEWIIAQGLGNAVLDYLDEIRYGSRG